VVAPGCRSGGLQGVRVEGKGWPEVVAGGQGSTVNQHLRPIVFNANSRQSNIIVL